MDGSHDEFFDLEEVEALAKRKLKKPVITLKIRLGFACVSCTAHVANSVSLSIYAADSAADLTMLSGVGLRLLCRRGRHRKHGPRQ